MKTSHTNTTAKRRTARRLAHEESGLTLIEVVVSALLVMLIGGSFVALGAVQDVTGDQQRRSQAADLAQQDQERMRGMSADQLASLDQTRTVTVDGVQFRVTSSGRFINRSAGSDSCSSAGNPSSADYIKISSSVTWGMPNASGVWEETNSRTPVVVNGLATPPAGGGVITKTVDQNSVPVSGAKILASGSSSATLGTRRAGTTDVNGCSIFPAMPVGDYDLSASLSGYVNADGASTSTSAVTATTTGTTVRTFSIGRAGAVTATFTTVIGGVTLTGQRSPAIGWSNSGMSTPRYQNPGIPTASIVTPTALYPFLSGGTGVYTNNYFVWAGSCAAAQPPTASRKYATVGPAVNDPETITMPGMDLEVAFASSSSRVVPSNVKLTDSCGQSWNPTLASNGNTATTGVFTYPGQPYGTYTVCAAYVSGGTSYRVTGTVANTNFAGTTTRLTIPNTTAARGTC